MNNGVILLMLGFCLLTSCNVDTKSPEVETGIVGEEVEEVTILETNTNTEKMTKDNGIQTAVLKDGDIVATMKTTNGVIKIKLFPELVPHTANNFIGLAQEGYYDGIIFHRVINNFMIQGGDPTGTGTGGRSIYGEKFQDEFSAELSNIPGSISMANSGENTNGSQFFINQGNNINLDFNKPPFTSKHAVFGQVIEGMDNVNKIAKAKTGAQDKPAKEIKIISIIIEEYNGGKYSEYKLDAKTAIEKYNTSLEEKNEAKKDKEISNGDTVSVHYTLTLEDGTKIDSSLDRGQPFEFPVGEKRVIPGWEKGVLGHKIGDKFKLEIEPKDGYGEYSEDNMQEVPREQLAQIEESGQKLEVGMQLQSNAGAVTIKEIKETVVIIDANHELAGKKLFFDIEVIDIK